MAQWSLLCILYFYCLLFFIIFFLLWVPFAVSALSFKVNHSASNVSSWIHVFPSSVVLTADHMCCLNSLLIAILISYVTYNCLEVYVCVFLIPQSLEFLLLI